MFRPSRKSHGPCWAGVFGAVTFAWPSGVRESLIKNASDVCGFTASLPSEEGFQIKAF